LHLDRLPTSQRNRLNLIQGSLMYRDRRLVGYDGAAVVEVVEHLDPPRLAAFERVLFEVARPTTIVLTTPNRDYNVRYPTLTADKLRHADHRFEWTRSEFRTWVGTIDERFGYGSRIEAIGPDDPEVGAPSQLVCFTKLEGP
jgi:3' terminal RNA ribose 2'-O-methyltransferase Hen1